MINGTPSRTARSVAILRAVHQLLDDGVIFNDPFALKMLDKQTAAAITDEPWGCDHTLLRRTRAFVAARSRFSEDALHAAFKNGVRQYVVLGAGLDTFAWRNPYQEQLQVFEVDHPATQEWKKIRLQENRLLPPPWLNFVAHDFAKETLASALRSRDFDIRKPAFFSWLGVTVYLEKPAIKNVLEWIAGLQPKSGIAFDYSLPPATLDPMERLGYEMVASQAAAMGEPWLSSFYVEELRTMLQQVGFHKLNVGKTELLKSRYLTQSEKPLRIGEGFGIAEAYT